MPETLTRESNSNVSYNLRDKYKTKNMRVLNELTITILFATVCLLASAEDLHQHHDQQSSEGAVTDSSHQGYRGIEGYRNYEPVERVDWSEANQTVDEIGGWRAYARDVYRYQRNKREELSSQ